MTLSDKWSYLTDLRVRKLPLDRRIGLQFMNYVRKAEEGTEAATSLPPKAPNDENPGVSCLNCAGRSKPSELYCSGFCRQAAELVRYVRRCQSDGRILREDVQAALGTTLLHLNGGGYPERERRLSKARREAVFARDDAKCQLCGGVATEIDHINGSSNDLGNLRAICAACNRRLAFDRACKADPEKQVSIDKLWVDLAGRIAVRQPSRICDDDVEWPARWRGLLAAARRKQAIV